MFELESQALPLSEEVSNQESTDEAYVWMGFCSCEKVACQKNEKKLFELENELKRALDTAAKCKQFQAFSKQELPPLPLIIEGWKKWKKTEEILVRATRELPAGSRDAEVLYSLKWGIGDVWGKSFGFWKMRESSFKEGYPGVLKAAPPADVDPIPKKKRKVWIFIYIYYYFFN